MLMSRQVLDNYDGRNNVNRQSDRQANPIPQIDLGRCNGCGLCVLVCPVNVLAIRADKAMVIDADGCRYHGLCEMICPEGAIRRPFEIIVQ
jgi:NAD-dependent dihydropyrimidine dehydrogenase PreA subunit